jgi:hypothetical protein
MIIEHAMLNAWSFGHAAKQKASDCCSSSGAPVEDHTTGFRHPAAMTG